MLQRCPAVDGRECLQVPCRLALCYVIQKKLKLQCRGIQYSTFAMQLFQGRSSYTSTVEEGE